MVDGDTVFALRCNLIVKTYRACSRKNESLFIEKFPICKAPSQILSHLIFKTTQCGDSNRYWFLPLIDEETETPKINQRHLG